MSEEFLEHTLKSGKIVTISKTKYGYEVDMWQNNGENRWNRSFANEADAMKEFNRWKD